VSGLSSNVRPAASKIASGPAWYPPQPDSFGGPDGACPGFDAAPSRQVVGTGFGDDEGPRCAVFAS
jgi:hypothetical protein